MMAVIVSLGKVELPHLTLPRIPTMTTKPTMSLAELAEKGADTDLLREMIQFVAQRMMEMDAESLCAAAYGERSPGSGQQPQRLPGTAVGDALRERGSEDPEAA
jgi:hypothetical protein